MPITLDDLRRFTFARNFFPPTTLRRAIERMGFVQADPIRAPARAQDLILRHRVMNYRAGDLERRYSTLEVDEDVFVNYGFVTRSLQGLMHPRMQAPSKFLIDITNGATLRSIRRREKLLLEFVRERGQVHPREVDEHFAHGSVQNYWGGSSNATTRLLEAMHYYGFLRVVGREKGIRIYSVSEHGLLQGAQGNDRARSLARFDSSERDALIDALVDVVVQIYSPLPGASLSNYVRRLRYAAPQWQGELAVALQRAKQRLSQQTLNGVEWYWAKDDTRGQAPQDKVKLLAPFDPLVHDRARFKLLWDWEYRFEAYTPASKRKLGYYALPLLWRDRVIGWANLSVNDGKLKSEFGYAGSEPRSRTFKRELEAEVDRIRAFLDLDSGR